ncbi:glycosyltransferase family 9 protein [Gluconacetobacter takamatsuzukensis]|uniref:ADP-heptose:LPS heptosyltransferase n=1 Tax=Gluconacetobacter takamatsuzukensis TaxID=1286190 RepID=A0A7W4PQU3_9PROT|nr:glycosyltransferase family 9 protein [Gluconacetobacter takamatsuzukensis]MBB2204864.1 hypothetical protein [Gluconacetobacter takamatsuzukensis]
MTKSKSHFLHIVDNLRLLGKATRRDILRRAEAAREQKRYVVAAELYEEVLRCGGVTAGTLLQAGHMHKEARDFPAAEERYLQADALDADNKEILLQLGHFYKTVGRFKDAERYYQRSLIVAPDWDEPRRELKNLRSSFELQREEERQQIEAEKLLLARGDEIDNPTLNPLVDPEIFARSKDELYIEHREAFVFTRNGLNQITRWGRGATVRGVDCLRGYIVSDILYTHIEIFLDGKRIYKGDLIAAPQRREKTNRNIKKYVYNAWIDFSDVSRGWHDLVFRAVNIRGDMREGVDWRRDRIIVADPVDSVLFGDSDGVVAPPDPNSSRSLVEQINGRPSVVHKCSPNSLPFKPKHIAVLRPDQLGDMVVSVPALMRLKEIFPDTKITGLLSHANEGLARTLGVFDDIVIVDFPDDPYQQMRVMEREGQEALMRQLEPYKFDLVIDMPVSGNSFRLLPLVGAPLTVGFGGSLKSIEVSISSHDPRTGNDFMKHSARTRMLVEALALSVNSGAKIVRRDDLSRTSLISYGLLEDVDYVVLHSGSRIKFTQWPHYTDLARKIVEELGKVVVFMAETEDQKALLPAPMLADGRIIYINQKLPFDDFDAFLSFASVFVGNDSGPKHLASLRGAQVVSIHSSRIGWVEWGQELTGVAISRRVPCAGCSLHHDYEECGHDVACIKYITVDEVFGEVKKMLLEPKEKGKMSVLGQVG